MNRKKLIPLFAAICLLLAAVPFQGSTAAQDRQDQQGHGAQADTTMGMENKEFFQKQFMHLMPHPLTGNIDEHGHADKATLHDPFTFFNLNLWQIIAIGLIGVVFVVVLRSFRGGQAGFLTRVFRGWVLWLRDELVYNVMGPEDGRKFAPYFMYLFFFIAFMNLLGLLPLIGVTATASLFVTGSLALITLGMMVGFGVKQQGPLRYVRNLLPHGLPIALLPLMAVVELVGLFIKPFALMVRLFANMLAGHMIIYSFVGMIFVFAKMLDMYAPSAIATAVPSVLMGVFICIIEAFIALLQAYIFVFLSVIFVHQSMHPAH
ncbi:MAG: F0F1 ATP synthase subunit A [Planctomycetota bacterium]